MSLSFEIILSCSSIPSRKLDVILSKNFDQAFIFLNIGNLVLSSFKPSVVQKILEQVEIQIKCLCFSFITNFDNHY